MTDEWTVQSLDLVLGLVGGFSSIVWAALLIIFGHYEEFKLNNSVIRTIYSTRPHNNNDNDPLLAEQLSGGEKAK